MTKRLFVLTIFLIAACQPDTIYVQQEPCCEGDNPSPCCPKKNLNYPDYSAKPYGVAGYGTHVHPNFWCGVKHRPKATATVPPEGIKRLIKQ